MCQKFWCAGCYRRHGSNGCEYMTGGEAVILGATGNNFGAGMTGGMAFIYDPDNQFEDRANPETLFILPLSQDYWQDHLKSILTEHVKATDSALARQLLTDWDVEKRHFKQVVPKKLSIRWHILLRLKMRRASQHEAGAIIIEYQATDTPCDQTSGCG